MFTLDFMQTLGAGGLTLLLGQLIRRVLPVTARYNLPGPVLGGLVVALFMTAFRRDGATPLQFDTQLQTPLMVAFFTTLGFGASLGLLRKGGPHVVIYLVACTVLAIAQNVVGSLLAVGFGLPPLFGVMAGSVTLTGGPGTGLAFAQAFEDAGLHAASTVAVTSAMGGIVLGGVLAAPAATWLINRHRLQHGAPVPAAPVSTETSAAVTSESGETLLFHVIILLLAMWLGGYVSRLISSSGVTLPAYIGSMLVAAVIRNVDDRTGWFHLDHELLDKLGNVALSLFLALSLMTLKLWELSAVAGPLVVILLVQSVFMVALAVTVMFRVAGRDYDAAVMSGGLIGFMMGTTANAMAAMDALTRRYGAAPRAYQVVPLVGACFIDFTNSVIITACLNLMR
jgi:ESS family glutamate:Na+ symporter